MDNPQLMAYARIADDMRRRGHIIYVAGAPKSVRTSDFGLPMNGAPLQIEELYSVDHLVFEQNRHRAEQHAGGVYLPGIDTLVPFCVIEDAHDYTHISHCLKKGVVPSPDALIGLLNREELERIPRA